MSRSGLGSFRMLTVYCHLRLYTRCETFGLHDITCAYRLFRSLRRRRWGTALFKVEHLSRRSVRRVLYLLVPLCECELGHILQCNLYVTSNGTSQRMGLAAVKLRWRTYGGVMASRRRPFRLTGPRVPPTIKRRCRLISGGPVTPSIARRSSPL